MTSRVTSNEMLGYHTPRAIRLADLRSLLRKVADAGALQEKGYPLNEVDPAIRAVEDYLYGADRATVVAECEVVEAHDALKAALQRAGGTVSKESYPRIERAEELTDSVCRLAVGGIRENLIERIEARIEASFDERAPLGEADLATRTHEAKDPVE